MSSGRLVSELMRLDVQERVRALRQLSYRELQPMPERTVENVAIQGRKVFVTVVVDPVSSVRLRVIVQGSMQWRFFTFGASVFNDGFFKNNDESIDPMGADDFHGYD